jgi:hypothetical protein
VPSSVAALSGARPIGRHPGERGGAKTFFRRRLPQPLEKARSAVRNGRKFKGNRRGFWPASGAPRRVFAHPERFLKSAGRLPGGIRPVNIPILPTQWRSAETGVWVTERPLSMGQT